MAVNLRIGLQQLGDPTGKSEKDFVQVLGNPQTISALPDGRRLLQWQNGVFSKQHLAVAFKDAYYVAVTHRHNC